MSYNIAALNIKNKTWRLVGTTKKDSLTLISAPTKSLDELSHLVCMDIMKYETSYAPIDFKIETSVCTSSPEDIISFKFIDALKYRGGSVYWGIQYSYKTQKTRIIAYGTDKVHHSGGGFRTNPLSMTNSIIEDFNNKVDKFIINKEYDSYNLSLEIIQALENDTYIRGI